MLQTQLLATVDLEQTDKTVGMKWKSPANGIIGDCVLNKEGKNTLEIVWTANDYGFSKKMRILKYKDARKTKSINKSAKCVIEELSKTSHSFEIIGWGIEEITSIPIVIVTMGVVCGIAFQSHKRQQSLHNITYVIGFLEDGIKNYKHHSVYEGGNIIHLDKGCEFTQIVDTTYIEAVKEEIMHYSDSNYIVEIGDFCDAIGYNLSQLAMIRPALHVASMITPILEAYQRNTEGELELIAKLHFNSINRLGCLNW